MLNTDSALPKSQSSFPFHPSRCKQFSITLTLIVLQILFDNNVPSGVRPFLSQHEVRTILQMKWSPRLKNGELLTAAEAAGFDVLLTCDQNIIYQQNLTGRKLALGVLG